MLACIRLQGGRKGFARGLWLRVAQSNNGASFLELFLAFWKDIGTRDLTPIPEMLFVAGEHVPDLLLRFHVQGKGWSV